jgi:hypothetical protein
MKVIFLDIDGVLALPRQFNTRTNKLWAKDTMAANLKVSYMWDERCVIALNRFILLNDVEIVLSSDWRRHYPIDTMRSIFQINGVARHPIAYTGVEVPAHSSGWECERVYQIENWVKENNPAQWVAVDDMNLVALGDRFVRTDDRMGLGENQVIEKMQNALLLTTFD